MPVKLRQWRGAFLVHFHADTDRLGPVVFALNQRSATFIANTFLLRRHGCDVENGFAFRAGAPTAEAGDDFINRQFVAEDGVEFDFFGREDLFQRLGLGRGAWETIEQKTAGTAQAFDAFAHDVQHRGVRHQVATFHEVERRGHGRAAFRGSQAFGGAENVTGREVTRAEFVAE